MQCYPYNLWQPEALSSNLVFSSPHSGAEYPAEFVESSILEKRLLRSSEDAFVHDLYRDVPNYGAPLLAAKLPRAFLDLNRSADELDSALIIGAPKRTPNPRVASGLGVIPRVVSEGRVIRRGKISLAEAQARIESCYHPYHKRLQLLLNNARAEFGQAILIDCHSMPHGATENMVVKGGRRPDVVIGDRYGASAPLAFVEFVHALFVKEGFAVSRNVPFAGAFNLQTYGRPSQGMFAVQIEIDRAIYMDEHEVQKSASYWDVKSRISNVVESLCAENWNELPIAAE